MVIAILGGKAHAAGGRLLWQDQFNKAGSDDLAAQVTAQGHRVFAVGWARSAPDNRDFLLRAYDSRTGRLLWQDQLDRAGGDDYAVAVAAGGDAVFVGGSATNGAGNNDFLVRAYDARTGALVWEDQFDLAGGFDSTRAVAKDGNRVFAAGVGQDAAGNDTWLVRAYNARTGTLLWENRFNRGGRAADASSMTAAHQRVFVVGAAQGAGGDIDFVVRTYHARTGALLWEDRRAGGEISGTSIIADGSRLFVTLAFVVRAYDMEKGTLLWENQFGAQVLAVAAAHGRVFAVGGNPDFVVRAYDAATGAVL